MYLALFFELKRLLVCAAFLEFNKIIVVLRVHQIKIKIVHAAYFKLAFKEGAHIRLGLEKACRQLVGKNVLLARITVDKALAQRLFALTAEITVRRVKVIEAGVDKIIDHSAEFFMIDLAVLHRQTHTSEFEILFYFFKITHLPSSVYVITVFFFSGKAPERRSIPAIYIIEHSRAAFKFRHKKCTHRLHDRLGHGIIIKNTVV